MRWQSENSKRKIRKTYVSESITTTKKSNARKNLKCWKQSEKQHLVANGINKTPGNMQSIIFSRHERDQLPVSPNNNHTSSRKKVMRIKTLVNDMIFSCCLTKLLTTEYSKRCLTMDKEMHVLKLSTEKKRKKFLYQILYATSVITQADI